jgi:hypothetical protein
MSSDAIRPGNDVAGSLIGSTIDGNVNYDLFKVWDFDC